MNRMTSGRVDLEAAEIVVNKHQLNKKTRVREFVYKRAIFFKFMREHSTLSLEQIGKLCGGLDHATVLHGIKVFDMVQDYDDFRHYKNMLHLDLINCLMYDLKTECVYTNEAIALVQMEVRIAEFL